LYFIKNSKKNGNFLGSQFQLL